MRGGCAIDTPRARAFGDKGPLVGNRVLTAMLLDLGICVLRRHGIRALTNRPVNEQLRRYYAMLGFANGEWLDLYDERPLTMAFDFIERVYARFGFVLVDDE